MSPEEKDLLVRVAPAYIIAAAVAVSSFIQVRNLRVQRKQNNAEHESKMADMKVAARERIERFEAWRAAQPNLEDIIAAAETQVGSTDDVRRKMEDPNHIWKL